MKIEDFRGTNRFLSNFYPCSIFIEMEGLFFPSVEHAYQAAKTIDIEKRYIFCSEFLSAAHAKKEGRLLEIRSDWDEIKIPIMTYLVRQKFSMRPLRKMLLKTGDSELIERNWWGDTFWGVCNGKGENHLGKILMQVRRELQEKK